MANGQDGICAEDECRCDDPMGLHLAHEGTCEEAYPAKPSAPREEGEQS